MELLLSTCVLAFIYGLYRILQSGKRRRGMPPGPSTLPVLGNIHQIPITGLYKQFRTWAKQYGSVYSLKMGPSNIIVLCDRKAIQKLLVENGSIYSDRPDTYVGTLLTRGDHVAINQMDSTWREKRKVAAHNFSPKQLDEKHYKVQEAEATVLMADLLDTPEEFFNHVRRYTASVATSIVYGCRGSTFKDFWAHGVFDVMEKWTACMEPGANPPVDEFKFLKYIPLIFAPWKRRALDAGKTMDDVWGEAYQRIEKRRQSGERKPCIIDDLLDDYNRKGWPMSEHAFTNLMGELVEGGADTTAAQLLTLILAFALYPEVQTQARRDIDAVCGCERSPTWSDFKSLPYINAIVKEGMRWRPVAVTALPHRAREDNEYEGMLIPKDSTIFIPTWALHHTDSIYADPDRFNPDRYLGYDKLANDYAGSSDYERRDHYNYGAGRRICPGIHLAERNMWRIAAKLLWAYEFAETTDAKGNRIRLDPDAYNPGILQAPLPFKVNIKPRSQRHINVIRRERAEASGQLQVFE